MTNDLDIATAMTHEQQGQTPVGLCLKVCALELTYVNKYLSDHSIPHCNIAAIPDSFFCYKVLDPYKIKGMLLGPAIPGSLKKMGLITKHRPTITGGLLKL